MKTILTSWLVFFLTTSSVYADGKFYWREKIPPDLPYQRALLLFDGNSETLILQSQFSTEQKDGHSEMGWIVPVPAVPDLASMPSEKAFYLFWRLDRLTSPHVIQVSRVLIHSLFLLSVLFLMLSLVPKFRRLPWVITNLRRFGNICSTIILFWFLSGFVGSKLMSSPEVNVLKSESVGIYDVKVITSSSPNELIRWLNDNGFQFDPTDTKVFSNYLDRGWCFTVARINSDRSDDSIIIEGLAEPLILRFPTTKAVYPLMLTATGGTDTEILLYVASDHRMTCKNRLPLHYAGNRYKLVKNIIKTDSVTPDDFFSSVSTDLPLIMKFKGTLSPDEMREDLVFTPDPEKKDYRKTTIVW